MHSCYNDLKIFIFLTIVPLTYCNWESEWLLPIQNSYSKETPKKISDDGHFKLFGDEIGGTRTVYDDRGQQESKNKDMVYETMGAEGITSSLTEKLRSALENARTLAETLKTQIVALSSRETLLKETIVNGRSGVTVLNLVSSGKVPRTYIIRDGYWTLCNGMVQYPTTTLGSNTNTYNELFAAPRCIGQEVMARQDQCVFNSVVKYETIPKRRQMVYSEDEYLCLKPNFNQTLEQYLSVPRHIINETCRDGLVKRLADNTEDCGLRMMSEYTYYPQRSAASINLPLEYCTENDGACKLIVAWHISNTTIENFAYLKNDKSFKSFFMNPEYYDNNKPFM